jgi:hypothetical protein
VVAVAIREQRLLSLTYVRAIEPQLFAPVTLYVSASNRLMLGGYELRGETERWRELELTQVRDVRQTLQSFSLDTATPPPKSHPIGATVIAQAGVAAT